MHRAAALLLLPLSLALLGTVPAHARIGDTPMQIAARYGAGKVVGEQLLYTVTLKEVIYQEQIFFDPKGLVSMEIFSRKNPNPDGSPDAPSGTGDLVDLTQADFDILLAEEEDAVPWRKADSTSDKQTWVSGNNRAFGRYQASSHLFLFLSPKAQPFVPTTSIENADGSKVRK